MRRFSVHNRIHNSLVHYSIEWYGFFGCNVGVGGPTSGCFQWHLVLLYLDTVIQGRSRQHQHAKEKESPKPGRKITLPQTVSNKTPSRSGRILVIGLSFCNVWTEKKFIQKNLNLKKIFSLENNLFSN